MLLNSVVIILREVLEAVLLISLFLVSASFLQLRDRWLALSLLLGGVGALGYGMLLEPVSELFGGVGQEVCNALLQAAIFVLIAAIAFLIPLRMVDKQHHQSGILALMVVAVALAISREGSEIFIYVAGFWNMSEFFSAVAIGSFIGACIGISVGVLIYYLLLAQPLQRALRITVALLFFVAAGMSSQAVRLLIQADWISSAGALWDTSGVLPEQSLAGQLLYALVGYEATPAGVEVLAYVVSIILVGVFFFAGRRWSSHSTGNT